MEEQKETQQAPQINVEDIKRLVEENKQLRGMVQQLNDARGIKRLEFLFSIVENAVVFPKEVIDKTVSEITSALFEEEKAPETKE